MDYCFKFWKILIKKDDERSDISISLERNKSRTSLHDINLK